MPVKAVPDGYRTVTPYLVIRGAAKAIEFYKRAFGAQELMRFADPSGRIGHAEIRIGDSHIMLADDAPDHGCKSPTSLNGTPVGFLLYVEDADRVFQQAVDLGATVLFPVKNQFYGDRSGTVTDPFGHMWTVATHVEDVSPEELRQRAQAHIQECAGAAA